MKALILCMIIGWNSQNARQLDSVRVDTLEEVNVHPDKSDYHVYSNFSTQLFNLNKWTIVDSSERKSAKQLVFCTRAETSVEISIQEIVIKAPTIDTTTHEVYCIIIQNGKIIYLAPIHNKFHSRKAVVFDQHATKIKKGNFFIGITVKQKCPTCYYSQNIIPNKNSKNFMTTIKDNQKYIDERKMIPIEDGIQYKLVYSL